MLSSEEMSALQEDETYRATRSWKYNWRYAKRALNLGFNELALHSPRDNDRCSATGFQRLLWPISKRWVIAKEIGQFRNDVIENAFTPGVRKLDFEQILSKGDYIWMELDAKKLKFIREITILFLADIQVSAALYHYSHILKKEEEYRKIEKEIEKQCTKLIWKLSGSIYTCEEDAPMSEASIEIPKEMLDNMTGDLTL